MNRSRRAPFIVGIFTLSLIVASTHLPALKAQDLKANISEQSHIKTGLKLNSKLQPIIENFLHATLRGEFNNYESISITLDPNTGKIQNIAGKEKQASSNSSASESTSPQLQNSPTSLKLIFPTNGNITQGYFDDHPGLDIANKTRPAVWAAAKGKVTEVHTGCEENSPTCGEGNGNYVVIDHGNDLTTFYSHLESVKVKVGDTVEQGEYIGKMGRSGKVYGKTGIFLHFEVRNKGVPENPNNYF